MRKIQREKILDVFDIKRDLIQTLVELGLDKDEILVQDKSPLIIILVFRVQFYLKKQKIFICIFWSNSS